MNFFKWLFGSKEKISKKAIRHSSLGEFKRSGRIKSGGHGEENLKYLKDNKIKYNIVKTYSNGVRTGNIPTHDNKMKRVGEAQSWFPKNWTRTTIKRAGQVVARGNKYPDGEIKSGHYNNVNIGIIRTNSEIATIFPMSPQKNKKGVIMHEQRTHRKNNRKKKKY